MFKVLRSDNITSHRTSSTARSQNLLRLASRAILFVFTLATGINFMAQLSYFLLNHKNCLTYFVEYAILMLGSEQSDA